jgi:replication initiation and membrane attachment protein
MRIEHVHQYTEHHRYYAYRDYSLSALDLKTIQFIYQPMIGAVAASFYQLLYHQVPEGKVGYSVLEPQRKLFLSLGLEMNDAGRRRLAEEASRLEAVGLLQTSRIVLHSGDDIVYEYALQAPLSPADFFRTNHLVMLLRDRIGKYAVVALGEQFYAGEPDELAEAQPMKESISVPFYELFRLNTHAADEELEQALSEVAPARARVTPEAAAAAMETAGISYGELILRFPRNAANRANVELLRTDEEGMAIVNYVAYKYELTAADMCRLLDEDGIFSPGGELLLEDLQRKASQLYRQDRKRSEARNRAAARAGYSPGTQTADQPEAEMPDEVEVHAQHYLEVPKQLEGRCDAAQYNMLMRNEPYTRFLKKFFPGAVPDWIDREFERIDLNYKLPDGAINVLIHYVLGMNDSQRLTKGYIESVVSNMLIRTVDSYEKAVAYVQDQMKIEQRKKEAAQGDTAASGSSGGQRRYNSGGRGGTRSAGGGSRKPSIPIVEQAHDAEEVTPEELERILSLAKKLDGNKRGEA